MTFTFAVTNGSPDGRDRRGPDGLGHDRRRWSPTRCRRGSSSSLRAPAPQPSETVTCTSASGREPDRHRVVRRPGHVPADAGNAIQNTASVATAAAGDSRRSPTSTRPTTPIARRWYGQPAGRPVADQDRLGPNPGTDDEVDYTLTAHNAGPNDATGVTINDSLPAGLDFLDASPGCDNNAGTVTCDIGTIANGDSASVTIKLGRRRRSPGPRPATWRRSRATSSTPTRPTTRRARRSTSSRSSTSS